MTLLALKVSAWAAGFGGLAALLADDVLRLAEFAGFRGKRESPLRAWLFPLVCAVAPAIPLALAAPPAKLASAGVGGGLVAGLLILGLRRAAGKWWRVCAAGAVLFFGFACGAFAA
ncbi:MAG: hypothetical protein H5T97_05230 [Firmicutes bacterium]|nr:hypothetical protein [Bacillota bacterium]